MGSYQNLIDLYEKESKKYDEHKEACNYAIQSIYTGLLKFFDEDFNIILKGTRLYRNEDKSFFREFNLVGISKNPLTCMITIRYKEHTTYSATIGTRLGISKPNDFDFKRDVNHIIHQNNDLYEFLYNNLLVSIPEHIEDLVEL